jgi:hypothetical protein
MAFSMHMCRKIVVKLHRKISKLKLIHSEKYEYEETYLLKKVIFSRFIRFIIPPTNDIQ